jgi:hypothetical protein
VFIPLVRGSYITAGEVHVTKNNPENGTKSHFSFSLIHEVGAQSLVVVGLKVTSKSLQTFPEHKSTTRKLSRDLTRLGFGFGMRGLGSPSFVFLDNGGKGVREMLCFGVGQPNPLDKKCWLLNGPLKSSRHTVSS